MHGQIQTEIQAWSWPVWLMSKALLWNQLGKAAGALNRTQRLKQREKKREGDCRAQIKFHCLFARPSPSLPSVLHHQPFLFYFFRNQAKPCQSLAGQGSMSVKTPIWLKPSTSCQICQIWQPCSAWNNLTEHELSAEAGKTLYGLVWKRTRG